MSKLIDYINGIAADKAKHFIAGLFITQFFLPLFYVLHISYLAGVPAIVLGVGKEVWDKKHASNHTVEALDAAWTILGGLAGLLFGLWCRL